MPTVPSPHAVLERLGPSDGTSTTIYLSENPLGDFPRELRPGLCEYIENCLPGNQLVEVSEHVPHKLKDREHAFAKVVLVGVLPSRALTLVRKAVAWFLESLVPAPIKRAEKALRLKRVRMLKTSRRKERYKGRRYCRKQRFS